MRMASRFTAIERMALIGMMILVTGGSNVFPLTAAVVNTATVTLSPAGTTVASGGAVAYYAAVTGRASQTVTWFVDGIAKGNATVGSISPNGDGAHVLYTAPATGGAHTIKAVATNSSGVSVSGSTTVTVAASGTATNTATVTLSPANTTVASGASVAYYSAVTGSASQTVTWFVDGISKGNSTVGLISPNGDGAHVLYTAPASGGTHTIKAVATNAAGASVSGSTSVTVSAATQPTTQPATNTATVTLSPANATMAGGASVAYYSAVTGSASQTVTWFVDGISRGNSTVGLISPNGDGAHVLYTAPATGGTHTIKAVATNAAGASVSGSTAVTVQVVAPVPTTSTVSSVAVAPTSLSLNTGTQRQFTVTVTGTGSYSSGVTWSAQRGSITSSGLYTAPSTSGSDVVTATSAQDSSKVSSASVTVAVPPVSSSISSVTLSPATYALNTGAQVQFTASVAGSGSYSTGVTWSAQRGSITSAGLYTAPASSCSDVVTAASAQDASKTAVASVIVSASSPSTAIGPLAAFPGAEGMGAGTTGGRGGVVYTVNSLDDTYVEGTMYPTPNNGANGPRCTLRDALQARGARTVVFSVSGTIELKGPIYPIPPDLTIAGQTSPGGIQVKGNGTFGQSGSMLHIGNNTIIRYMRFRPGAAPLDSSYHGLSGISAINADTINHMIDHNSFEWDGNKCIAWGITHGVTMSWNLMAEGMEPHSTGPLVAGPQFDASAQAQALLDTSSFDGHHNIIASTNHRLPHTWNKYVRWVNNLVFGYAFGGLVRGNTHADIIGNVYDGLTANLKSDPYKQEWRWADTYAHNENQIVPGGDSAQFFMQNNFGPHNPNGTLDNFTTMLRVASSENSQLNDTVVDARYKATAPTSMPAALNQAPITTTVISSPAALKSLLIPSVGACHRLTEDGRLVGNRDSADTLILDYVANPANSPSDYLYAPRTYPLMSGGAYPTCSMKDGIPDTWKVAHGLSTTDPNLRNTVLPNANGFTILDLYLSGQFPNGTPLP